MSYHNTTFYVSPTKVKQDTSLGYAVDPDIIHPHLRLAQDKEILPYLGTKLDHRLKELISTDTIDSYEPYETLLQDYIVPALVQFTFVYVAPALRLRFSNNAVSVPTSEQGQSASQSDMKPVIDNARQMAEFYRERMVQFILHNKSDYPEYQENTGADLHPTSRAYFENLNVDRPYRSNQEKGFLAAINAYKYL